MVRKSRSKAQILTFSASTNQAYDNLLEDANQINFVLSVCTITLQNPFHLKAFPSISIDDLFPVIDVSRKLHEHAQNRLMQINS